MAVGSGLSSQFGMKKETTYGTPVTVDRFLDIISSNIVTEVGKIETPVLTSQYLTTGAVATYVKGAGGDVEMPVMNVGMGQLFLQMFGSVATAQVGATTEYTHTFTPDAAGLFGTSATVQIGKPAVSGTVHPFTYEGGKVVSWSFNLAVDGALTLTTTWAFENVLTATALASPSYTSGRRQFHWAKDATSITWGGTEVCVRELTISGERAFDMDRFCLGSTGRKEPILNGMSSVTVEASGEFASLAAYNDFIAGTQRELVITIAGETIPAESNPFKLVFTVAAADLTDPGEPEVSGPEILVQPLNFRALDNGTDPVVELVYHTTDATP